MVFPAPPIVWCVKTARSNTGEQLIGIHRTEFRLIEAKLHIFGDMLAYLSRLVPADHLEDYSYLCPRRSDARLLLLTPGAVRQQCSAAPFKFCPPTLHYHNEKVSPLNFRGQFGDKLENLFYYIVDL